MEGTESLIPTLVGSSAVTAVLVAIVTALLNRRKLKAESTSIISQAAGGLVEQIMADNTRLRAELAVADARVDDLELRERRRDKRDFRIRESMREHNAYDVRLAEQLRAQGIEVPMPPALLWPDEDEG